MNVPIAKVIRTLQSEFAILKSAKDGFYYHSRRLLRRPHESDFHALRFLPADGTGLYVDVGANHGQSIESIRSVVPGARVHSFEANPMLAERLQARYAATPAVRVESFGLADCVSERPLYVPVYKGYVYDGIASFDRGSAQGWLGPDTLYFFSPERLRIVEVTCATRRLDDLSLVPILIKIDVQGLEYEVVRGGIETIRRHEPVLLVEDYYRDPRLEALLGAIGYRQYLFDDRGFFPQRDPSAVNTFAMTEAMAARVVQSPRARGG